MNLSERNAELICYINGAVEKNVKILSFDTETNMGTAILWDCSLVAFKGRLREGQDEKLRSWSRQRKC